MTATCWSCGSERDLHDLLVVRDLVEPDRPPWHVCRPSVPGGPGDCLRRGAGSAARYRVNLAVADVPVPRPAPERAAPVARHDVVYRPGRIVARDVPDEGPNERPRRW